MPVFAAFGWAGEEAALKFAYSQLEQFITLLHARLPTTLQGELPVFGLSKEGRGVYLAADPDVESQVHIAFYARPLSFELQLAVTNKDLLTRALKQIEKDTPLVRQLLLRLGPEWTLHVQQLLLDEKSGERVYHQDLFKDSVNALDDVTAVDLFSKAAYLNSEDKWVTPIYVSQRFQAEQIAAMGPAILGVMTERIDLLRPLMRILSGQAARRQTKGVARRPVKERTPAAVAAASVAKSQDVQPKVDVEELQQFTYLAELKPLHIRRGFINMTPHHWPFFAISARTETRKVTVVAGSLRDKECAVWRLQPENQARLVLTPRVQVWLEDTFTSNDHVQITVTKMSEDEIQIVLEPAN